MRSNVPIALSRRSAYRVCGAIGVGIDILLKAGACVRPGSSSVQGPKMLGRIGSPRPPSFGSCDHLSGARPAFLAHPRSGRWRAEWLSALKFRVRRTVLMTKRLYSIGACLQRQVDVRIADFVAWCAVPHD